MTLKLNKHENATALHRQLLTYFRERILDGRLPEGARLPTELELATEHQISRDTIRHALGLLVEEGLLERVPGRGTFVRRTTAAPPIESMPVQDKRIGIVLNRPTGAQLNMDILIAVEQAVKMGGYHASFTYAEENQVQFARDIKRLRVDHVQGLIVFPICDTSYEETIWQLQAEHFPLVLIDRYYPDLETDYVGSDNVGGGFRATEHLLILGHHRVVFCHSPIETIQTTSVRDRWEGYRKALQEYGISYDESLVVPNKRVPKNEIIDLYEALLRRPDRPTAIFAVNDLAALDVLTAAQNCGLRVPDDLAIVGFDDLDFAPRVHPPLTTVNQPLADIGLYAGKLLINRIEGQAGPPKHIELPTRLIVRSSCGARLRVKKATATIDPS